MCQFLSAVLLRNGDLIWYPETDAHTEILLAAGINETDPLQEDKFCRLEFVPPVDPDKMLDPANWRLIVDEICMPEWVNRKKAREKLEQIVKAAMTREGGLLIGGLVIAVNRQVNVYSANVFAYGNSHVTACGHSYVSAHGKCQIEMYNTSKASIFEDCTLGANNACYIMSYGRCKSRIRDWCTIEAYGESKVDASDYCGVIASDYSTYSAGMACRIHDTRSTI